MDARRHIGFQAGGVEKAGQDLLRQRLIIAADADRSEEMPIARMARDERADAFPQKQQRAVVTLILGPHKRAAELEGRTEFVEKRSIVPKERARIQPAHSEPRQNLVRLPDAIRADHFRPLVIPYDHVQVVIVVTIEIALVARAFAHCAKRHLPQSSDFGQSPWQLRGWSDADCEGAAL